MIKKNMGKHLNERDKKEKAMIGLLSFLSLALLTAFIVLNFEEIVTITTGHATFTPTTVGQINITITQNLTILFTNYNMSFGNGTVNFSFPTAGLNSSLSNTVKANLTLASSNWTNTSNINISRFTLKNDGNVNASVTVTGTVAATFLGGTSPSFQYNASQKEANSCNGGSINDWTEVSGVAQPICTVLSAWDTRDELYVDVRITIPMDASGSKETFFTFAATAVT